MSNVYSTEPQSTAQVVFETTHGPLSIHLFAKECPSTVRYFLQLCLDGYFNNLPFHRVMPGFLIQTGDASFRQATTDDGGQRGGDGGERNPNFFLPPTDSYRKRHGAQEALDRRRYELNSRIRFNHRGQVAMALTVEDSDDEGDNRLARLQSQFFVTLDEAGHLDGNHVVFGGVSGPTIFNAIRMGKTDSDESTHQPHVMEEAPRILKTKVQSIDGLPDTLPALVPTPEPPLLPWNEKPFLNPFGSKGGDSKRKKKARKGVKNVNLLSFGEEMTEEEEGDSASSKQSKARKIQSSHELLASSTGKKSGSGGLVPKVDEELERRLRDDKESNGDPPRSPSNESVMKRIDDSKAPKTKEQERAFQSATEQERTQAQQPPPQSMSSVPAPEQQFASAPFSETARKTGAVPRRSKQKKLSLVEARRAKYAKGNSKAGEGKNKQLRQEDTMKKLIAFQRKVVVSGGNTNDDKKDDKRKRDDNNNDGYHGQILEDNDYNADKDKDWIKTKFKCRRHMDADAKMGGDGRAASDYEVVEEHHSATDRKRDRTKSHHRP